MYRQIPWTKAVLDEFASTAMLTEEEVLIMQDRIHKVPQGVTADRIGVSVSTLNRKVMTLKKKYDEARAGGANLPVRIK